MEERDASAVVLEWLQHHADRDAAEQVFRTLTLALMSLVPDGAIAGVADVDGERVVIAVAGGVLLTASIDLSPDALEAMQHDRSPLVRCRVVRLDAPSSEITVEEYRTERSVGPVGVRETRHRRWRFGLAEPVEFSSEAVLRAPFQGEVGPNSAERVASAAARQLGWLLPDPALAPDRE